MSLSSLTSADLEKILALLREKEEIESRLEQINRQLAEIESGEKLNSPVPVPKRRRIRRRGGLKEAIIEKLRVAGKAGLTVKDLAASISASPGSVRVWVYTAGPKTKGFRKLGPGKFAIKP